MGRGVGRRGGIYRAYASSPFLRRRNGILGRLAAGNPGVSATTFEIGTGLYFIVMAMISSAIGGYLAGRLRTKWVGVQTTEVHFRNTAHGFLAWAAASVLGAVLLASPASSLIGGTLSGATQAAANSARSSPMDGYVDTLLRSDNPSSQGQQIRLTRVERWSASLRPASTMETTSIPPTEPTWPRSCLLGRISQPDAEKRVNDVITQAKADLDSAQGSNADSNLVDAVAVHWRVFRVAGRYRRRRTSRRHLGQEGLRHACNQSLTLKNERRDNMPILLWLVGIPIPLIILIMLLHH